MTEDADVVLAARGLTKRFGGLTAVDHVDLAVRRGTIHALIGPNGAGKTSLFNLLTRKLTQSTGTIIFDGRDISRARPARIARLGVARSFQISAVFADLSCLENLRIALMVRSERVLNFLVSERRLRRYDPRARELLGMVGLEDAAATRAGNLSYGRRRVLELATTLALDPTLLLLDEPMAGLGLEDIDMVTELIRDFGAGRTILMVEHNLSVVSGLCDRVTVMQQGRVLTEGDYATVAADPEVVAAYVGGGRG